MLPPSFLCLLIGEQEDDTAVSGLFRSFRWLRSSHLLLPRRISCTWWFQVYLVHFVHEFPYKKIRKTNKKFRRTNNEVWEMPWEEIAVPHCESFVLRQGGCGVTMNPNSITSGSAETTRTRAKAPVLFFCVLLWVKTGQNRSRQVRFHFLIFPASFTHTTSPLVPYRNFVAMTNAGMESSWFLETLVRNAAAPEYAANGT